jgi:Spy/CpxP family protein refolding chaperone
MSKYLAPFLFAAAMFVTPGVWAQGSVADVTDMQALRAAVKADKRALVTSALNLTPTEAKKFWPIYDAYQRSLDAATRERSVAIVELIGSDRPMSDPYAKNLAKDLVTADEAEIKARRTMYNRVMKALPPKKAVRYLQLESKIRAVQAYDIAVAIPLVK